MYSWKKYRLLLIFQLIQINCSSQTRQQPFNELYSIITLYTIIIDKLTIITYVYVTDNVQVQ